MTNLTERDTKPEIRKKHQRQSGWISIGGWTLMWKSAAAPRLFSERYGFHRWLTIWPLRVRVARNHRFVSRSARVS